MNRVHPRRLVIHIGDPKTGTSSLQRVLQTGLFEDASIKSGQRVSPYLDRFNSANAIGLARSFQKSSPPTRSIRNFETWIRRENADVMIVSSEFFYRADPKLLQHYLEERHPTLIQNTKIIAYVRPYLGRALSSFTERTKAGYTLLDFDSWLKKFINLGGLQYTERFENWRRCFGESFVLRPYIRNELVNQDVVADFFSEVLGPQDSSIRFGVNENQKISLRALAGLRYFNTALSGSGFSPEFRIPLSLMVSRFLRTNNSSRLPQLGDKSRGIIFRACRSDAENLDRAFFGKPLFLPDIKKNLEGPSSATLDLSLGYNFNIVEQADIADIVSRITDAVPKNFSGWLKYYRKFSTCYNVGGDNLKGGGDIQEMLIDLADALSREGSISRSW